MLSTKYFRQADTKAQNNDYLNSGFSVSIILMSYRHFDLPVQCSTEANAMLGASLPRFGELNHTGMYSSHKCATHCSTVSLDVYGGPGGHASRQ